MARVHRIQTNFSAGELDRNLRARTDLRYYYSGAGKLRNVMVKPQGGAARRPGLHAVIERDTLPALPPLHVGARCVGREAFPGAPDGTAWPDGHRRDPAEPARVPGDAGAGRHLAFLPELADTQQLPATTDGLSRRIASQSPDARSFFVASSRRSCTPSLRKRSFC